MESPIEDRNIIDIKDEKYKQIVPDSYIGRHVISVYDTCTVTRWCDVGKVTEDKYVFKLVIRFVAYVTKLSKSQTFLNKQVHLWQHVMV